MNVFGVPATPRQLQYAAGDLGAVFMAVGAAHAVYTQTGTVDPATLLERTALLASAIWILLYVVDAYDPVQDFRRARAVARVLGAAAAASGLSLLGGVVLPLGGWDLGLAGIITLVVALLLPAWRALLCHVGPHTGPRLRTLVVGAGPAGDVLAAAMRAQPAHDRAFELVGFVHDQGSGPGLPPSLAPLDELGPLARSLDIQQIVVSGELRDDALMRQLLAFKAHGGRVDDMPTIYKQLTGKVSIRHVQGAWLAFGPALVGTPLSSAVLRALDLGLALIGAVVSAPVVAVAAVVVRLDSSGPAFFFQERIGKDEQPFRMVKLRTMREDAEVRTGAVWSQGAGDPRVTRVGRLLRRTRIDELPQFYNVLRGEMSIVGPRPEREPFVTQLKERIPFYGLRFAVKPGVTGWAQVRYRYGASEEDAAEKLCYELYAIQEMGPVLYLLILLRTVQTVLFRPGS